MKVNANNGKLHIYPATAEEIMNALNISKEERQQARNILIKLFGDIYKQGWEDGVKEGALNKSIQTRIHGKDELF